MTSDPPEQPEQPEQPEVPLLTLRDGLPAVVDTPEAYAETVAAIAAGTGPVAIDAERASGYRYSQRAYLVQLRREGAGTHLVDPIPLTADGGDLSALDEAIGDAEWILHAATQDLACLREIGLQPRALFDTELGGRLLGFPRVALGTMVEQLLGRRLRKEHSAQDWSKRPLPEPWLEYAALDVEALIELREAMTTMLAEQGKTEWAREEFASLLDFTPAVRAEPWRRTSGSHKVRGGRRGLALVRSLWQARDDLARQRDTTPGRLLPDSALVAAASAAPTSVPDLLAVPGFRGRGAQRYARTWVAAINEALELAEDDLPARRAASTGPPPPRAWAERDPEAAERLTLARAAVGEIAEAHDLPVENLLAPDHLRRAMWQPPATRDEDDVRAALTSRLVELGSRTWQVEMCVDALVDAVLRAPEVVATRLATEATAENPGPAEAT
ncbi:HRDC domain-containing protein [Nocardioidaceae bacterium]|nr:HRDC domain-containing protein [Nocardioidaceae bacterium]